MPDRSNKGRGPLGRPGKRDEGHEGGVGQEPMPMDPNEHDAPGRGRSASSPGHLKKAAGAQSARDYAPGHSRGRAGIADVAPDEIGEEA